MREGVYSVKLKDRGWAVFGPTQHTLESGKLRRDDRQRFNSANSILIEIS